MNATAHLTQVAATGSDTGQCWFFTQFENWRLAAGAPEYDAAPMLTF